LVGNQEKLETRIHAAVLNAPCVSKWVHIQDFQGVRP